MKDRRQASSAESRPLALRARPWARFVCALGVLFIASGAGCPRILQQYTQPIPRALPPTPSLQQVIDVVNANSARVQSLSTTRATLSTPGFPSLNANIAFQRPRSFRLVGQKFGTEVDLGSNDELLWFWLRHAQPPALFYCRHSEFAISAARQVIPVEPEWLVEALGVVTFDPAQQIEGPFAVGGGRLEVKTKLPPGSAAAARITIIDESRGVVLEEHLYDAQGKRLAHALLSKHVYDPASQVTLPRHVEIQWPTTNLNLTIDLADLQVNQLNSDPQVLFAKPSYPGYNEVDLAHPSAPLTPVVGGPAAAPPDVRY